MTIFEEFGSSLGRCDQSDSPESTTLASGSGAAIEGKPKVSSLVNYQLEGFSVERLMNFLTALDQDVDIVIRRKPTSRKGGRILVTAA